MPADEVLVQPRVGHDDRRIRDRLTQGGEHLGGLVPREPRLPHGRCRCGQTSPPGRHLFRLPRARGSSVEALMEHLEEGASVGLDRQACRIASGQHVRRGVDADQPLGREA